jgi:hypothetical protein
VRAAAGPLIAVVLAFFVLGCGGDDKTESTGSVQTSTGSVQSPTNPQAGLPKGGEKPKPGGGSADKTTNPAPGPPQGLPPTDSSPLPNQGTDAVAPGVPTTTGGDNSVQGYGVESDGGERVEAATVVKAYLDAQVAGRWSEACSLLAAAIRTNLEALMRRAPNSEAKGCPAAMAAFIEHVPKGPLRTIAAIHVLSMRVDGDRGFLIFDDGEGRTDEMPLRREGGKWKVRALIAQDLLVH